MMITLLKARRWGYSFILLLWIIPIITIIKFETKFERGIEIIANKIQPQYIVYFILGVMTLQVIADFALLYLEFKEIKESK